MVDIHEGAYATGNQFAQCRRSHPEYADDPASKVVLDRLVGTAAGSEPILGRSDRWDKPRVCWVSDGALVGSVGAQSGLEESLGPLHWAPQPVERGASSAPTQSAHAAMQQNQWACPAVAPVSDATALATRWVAPASVPEAPDQRQLLLPVGDNYSCRLGPRGKSPSYSGCRDRRAVEWRSSDLRELSLAGGTVRFLASCVR